MRFQSTYVNVMEAPILLRVSRDGREVAIVWGRDVFLWRWEEAGDEAVVASYDFG